MSTCKKCLKKEKYFRENVTMSKKFCLETRKSIKGIDEQGIPAIHIFWHESTA